MVWKERICITLTTSCLLFAIIGLATRSWRISEVHDDGRAISDTAFPVNVDATAMFGLHDATLVNITCEISWLARCFPARRSQNVYVITDDEQEAIERATKCAVAFGSMGVIMGTLVWATHMMQWLQWNTTCCGYVKRRQTATINNVIGTMTALWFLLATICYSAVFPSLSTQVATFTWGYSFALMAVTTPLLVIAIIISIMIAKDLGGDQENAIASLFTDLWDWITALAVEDWEPAPIAGLITGAIVVTSIALGSDCWASPSQVCNSNTVRFGLRQAGLVNATLYLEDWHDNCITHDSIWSLLVFMAVVCVLDGMNIRVKQAADVVLTFSIIAMVLGVLTLRVLLLVMWGRIESRGRCPVAVTFGIGMILIFSVVMYASIFPDSNDINIYYPRTARTVAFGVSYPLIKWGWGFWLLLTVGLICIFPVFGWAGYKLLVRIKEMDRDETKQVSAAVIMGTSIFIAIIGTSTICWRVSTISCDGDSFGLTRASFRGLDFESSTYSAFDPAARTAATAALVLALCGFGCAFPGIYTSVLCAMGRAQRWKGRVEIIAISCCFLTAACWVCAPIMFGITWPTIRTMDITFANSTFGLNLPTNIDTGASVYDLGPTPLQYGYSFGLMITAAGLAVIAAICLLLFSSLKLAPMQQPVPGQIPTGSPLTFTDISPPAPNGAPTTTNSDSSNTGAASSSPSMPPQLAGGIGMRAAAGFGSTPTDAGVTLSSPSAPAAAAV